MKNQTGSKIWKSIVVLILAFTAGQGITRAGETAESINADRPDLANSAETVGSGKWQLESGIQRSSVEGVGGSRIDLPLLLRIGLGPSWEGRWETEGPFWEESKEGKTTTGLDGMGLGAKWTLLRKEGSVLETAGLLGEFSAQQTESGWRVQEAILTLAMDLALRGDWGLTVNLGYGLENPFESTSGQWSLAGSLGVPLTGSLSGYTEVSRVAREIGEGTLGVDGGMKWLSSPNTQWDLSAGRFWTGSESDWTLALGFSVRVGFDQKQATVVSNPLVGRNGIKKYSVSEKGLGNF